MRNYVKLFILSVIFVVLTYSGFAAGLLTPDELGFIDKIILFLENLDLDGLHFTLATIIAAILMLLRLFQKRKNKIDLKNQDN